MQQLTEGNEATKDLAVSALRHLAYGSTERKDAVVAAGALEPLVQLLTEGNAATKELAVSAPKELASGSTECKDAVDELLANFCKPGHVWTL